MDARRVEIGVYSTVGTSEVNCRHSAECRRGSVVKAWWMSAAMGEERAKKGVKDVVKIVSVCALENFPRTGPSCVLWNGFDIIRIDKGRKAGVTGTRRYSFA